MNRLQTELQRLYLPGASQEDADAPPTGLADADGRVRALVVELRLPVGWDAVTALWQGVQTELDLPAPAIAVNGVDGYQVWFSLQQPVAVTQAMAFLAALRRRYLGDMAPRLMTLMPALDASRPGQLRLAGLLPAVQAESGRWSAFLAPDLAGLFADEPWLDFPPSPDAQADLLLRLRSIKPADFLRVMDQLQADEAQTAPDPVAVPLQSATGTAWCQDPALAAADIDPRRFLLAVMRDPSAELGLRVEAAKALLPYFEGERRD